jgi:hypothetical protein
MLPLFKISGRHVTLQSTHGASASASAATLALFGKNGFAFLHLGYADRETMDTLASMYRFSVVCVRDKPAPEVDDLVLCREVAALSRWETGVAPPPGLGLTGEYTKITTSCGKVFLRGSVPAPDLLPGTDVFFLLRGRFSHV